ncbi:MAG TPA: hypothetical protein VKE24_04955 [Candidatus Acidoferrales bacterium]|nr:hypothetical protein [Candidatus Acidoferrales bacterium]
MRGGKIGWGLCLAASVLGWMTPAAGQRKKDYLTEIEADKIRDAETPSERIKLFLTFADDRIKKFQYELAHPSPDRRRGERLNALLNAYTGCLDDAAQIIELAVDKQQDVRAGVKEMRTRAKEFLTYLEGLEANGQERDSYKITLDDAREATKDALEDAEKAGKNIAPPVRRKQ